MTTLPRTPLALLSALVLALALALVPAQVYAAPDSPRAVAAPKAGASGGAVHRGNYTCYQGGLTSRGSLYWGYIKVKRANKYEIPGSKGKFKRKGKRLVFTKGSLKRWKWKGRYYTSKSGGGEKQWHIDLIDRPNEIRIWCSDGG